MRTESYVRGSTVGSARRDRPVRSQGVAFVALVSVLVAGIAPARAASGGLTWTPLSPAPAPAARAGHGLATDTTRDQIILFGGMDTTGQYRNDVWIWDMATESWTDVTPTSGPQPAARSSFGMAYDPVRDRVVIYGGTVSSVQSNVNVTGSTWEWDPATRTWEAKPSASTIVFVGLWGSELAFDPNLGRVILYGGAPYWQWPHNGETYAWTGTTWVLASASGPPGRVRHAMATDMGRSRVIVFGGSVRTDSPPATLANDVWEWNGVAWTQITPATATLPPPTVGGAMAYDAARGVSLLFGGSTVPTLTNQLWQWDGAEWEAAIRSVDPSPRWSRIAHDEASGKTLLFGGNGSQSPSRSSPGTGDGFGGRADTHLLEPDDDLDTFANGRDNCRCVANPTQADRDGDEVGDACDLVADAPVGTCVAKSPTDPLGVVEAGILVPQSDVECDDGPLAQLCL